MPIVDKLIMNFVLHFLISYLVIDLVFGNALEYALLIIIFSVFLDLDHLPYLLRTRSGIIKKRFGSESRTRFHELYGLAACSALLSLASLYFSLVAIQIAALSIILHLVTDFLVGNTRPFFPYSGGEVFLHLLPVKYRIHFEVAATAVLGMILWLRIAS